MRSAVAPREHSVSSSVTPCERGATTSDQLCARSLSARERSRGATGKAECTSGSDGELVYHDGESYLSTDHGRPADAIYCHRARRHLEIRKCLSYASHLRTAIATG
ncbi:MAG: hypothetical protein QOJ42_7053 [Acidobacteriaceae bacterium]|nr:hypothetical protein [Acidobacteriaceae bacterium]